MISSLLEPFFGRDSSAVGWPQPRHHAENIARALALTMAVLMTLLPGCSRQADGTDSPQEVRAENVIVIIGDALRADHMGLYGYSRNTTPFIDSIQDKALVFDHAFSHFAYTWPTVSNLFTGKPFSALVNEKLFVDPKTDSERGLSDDNLTLAERLTTSGVAPLGISANPYITSNTGFAQGFGNFHDIYMWNKDYWAGDIHKYSAEEVSEVAVRYLEQLSRHPDRSWFLYIHYFDPHEPYRASKSDRALFEDRDYDRKGRVVDGALVRPDGEYLSFLTDDVKDWVNSSDIDYLTAQYDAEIHHFDRAIKQLMKTLEKLNLSDRTAIILTADHGEAFMERKFWGHGFLARSEEEHVPLIVIRPGLDQSQNRRISSPVTTNDIFYSVLHHFGASTKVEGQSAPWIMDVFTGQARGQVAYSEGPCNAKIYRDEQYGFYRYRDFGPCNWPLPVQSGDFLFDTQTDPGEQVNLLTGQQPQASRIRDELISKAGISPDSSPAYAQDPFKAGDKESIKKLKALGYVK